MIYKNIIIFSLEGIESNTEVNFFKGLSYHLKKTKIQVFAIGKQGRKIKDEKRIQNRIIAILTHLENLQNAFVFFVGDGDREKEIEPMERARTTVMEELNTLFEKKFNFSKLIYEKTLSFDDVLNNCKEIKKANLINHSNNHKKKTNVNLFNNIIDCFGYENKSIKKILAEIFFKTSYTLIFDKIFPKDKE